MGRRFDGAAPLTVDPPTLVCSLCNSGHITCWLSGRYADDDKLVSGQALVIHRQTFLPLSKPFTITEDVNTFSREPMCLEEAQGCLAFPRSP